MSKGGNSSGVSKLAGILKVLVDGAQESSPLIDFGVVQRDKSLLTNSFPIAIPQSEYLVCGHIINVPLKDGDHVLVAWVQNDAVVIDVIIEAKEAFDAGKER